MEFCRQEYWSGLPVPSPGDLPNPEIEATLPTWQADSLPSEPLEKVYLSYEMAGSPLNEQAQGGEPQILCLMVTKDFYCLLNHLSVWSTQSSALRGK